MKSPWTAQPLSRVLVYGLGASGLAAARLLHAHDVAVVGVDRRPPSELAADLAGLPVELVAGGEAAALPPGIDAVVVSPGVPASRPLLVAARAAGVPVLAEVELAFPFLNGPLVGITGSNGKSTTTALTGELLRGAGFAVEVCGNIGRPLAGCVEGAAGRIFVVELSSFQLEAIHTLRPRAAAVLNVSPDHLDRHGSLQAYADAKLRLLAEQRREDVAVLNADDALVRDAPTAARRRHFSLVRPVQDGCYLDAGAVVETRPDAGPRELFRQAELPLVGLHNLENAMAAALLALHMGAEPTALATGLRGFHALPHRMEKVGEWDGVAWFDDSKGTNVGATAKSLAGFADGSVHLILGGRNKGADLRELRPAVGRKAARLYLIGESADDFRSALADVAPAEMAGTLESAVRLAAARATAGQAVVLSPACASFDQFRDFNDRGEQFQRLVRDLRAGARA